MAVKAGVKRFAAAVVTPRLLAGQESEWESSASCCIRGGSGQTCVRQAGGEQEGKKIRGGFILSLSRIGSSYCPKVEVPGVRAADEFGHDGEHAGGTLGTSASSHRIELGGRNTEVG